MKKPIMIVVMCLTLLVILIIAVMLNCNIINKNDDYKLWDEFKIGLKKENVSMVKISDINGVTFQGKEKDTFIDILKKSTFYKSNRELVGSTGLIISIQYIDGSHYSIEYFGGSLFELRYHEVQFFIENDEIKNMLNSYGVE